MANTKIVIALMLTMLMIPFAYARIPMPETGNPIKLTPVLTLGKTPAYTDYSGKSCKLDGNKISFSGGFMTCNYPLKDNQNNKWSCADTNIRCEGSKCPSRMCGVVGKFPMPLLKVPEQTKPTSLVKRTGEARLIKQGGSTPPATWASLSAGISGGGFGGTVKMG